jgi:hypothetical protein
MRSLTTVEPGDLADLADVFAELGRHTTDRDPTALLKLAVEHVDGCRWASITAVRDNTGATLAASDQTAREADLLQHRLGAGPCMQAAQARAFHTIFPTSADDRWPELAAALRDQGPVRAVLAVHMIEGDPTSLNLYSPDVDGFDEGSLAVAAIFAGQAAKLLTDADPGAALGELQTAVTAQQEIELAQDILVADRSWTREKALQALQNASRMLHRSLRSIAHEVATDGQLPGS